MFCSKCGENLTEGTVFCPKCGAKAGGDVPSVQSTFQPVQPAALTQPIPEMPKIKVIKALRVLSIIGFIWFPLSIFSYYGVQTEDQVFSFTFIIFGYAIAQAIVALVQGSKNKIKAMTVMAVLGIVWYVLSSIFIMAFMYEDWEASQGWAILGLGYAIAFSIVCFIKAKVKQNPEL
jgi:hypothetical protein